MFPADDDLWLTFHRLSNALAEAGQDRERRLYEALSRFEALPVPVRMKLHKELRICVHRPLVAVAVGEFVSRG